MARKLTVVTEETAAVAKAAADEEKRKHPVTIKAAADLSERELLVAMRSKVATEIDAGVPAHSLAALMRQLREFDKEIRLIDSRAGGDEIGDAANTPDAKFDAEAL